MSLTAKLSLSLTVDEQGSGDLGTPRKPHAFDYVKALTSGVGSNQGDLVWSDQRVVAAAPEQIDLRGVLADAFGVSINFVKIIGVFVKVVTETTGYVLVLGNDPNAFFSGLLNAAPDRVKVQPGGLFAWFSPIDAATTVAGTGDILKVDPGANTITYQIAVIGRSS